MRCTCHCGRTLPPAIQPPCSEPVPPALPPLRSLTTTSATSTSEPAACWGRFFRPACSVQLCRAANSLGRQPAPGSQQPSLLPATSLQPPTTHPLRFDHKAIVFKWSYRRDDITVEPSFNMANESLACTAWYTVDDDNKLKCESQHLACECLDVPTGAAAASGRAGSRIANAMSWTGALLSPAPPFACRAHYDLVRHLEGGSERGRCCWNTSPLGARLACRCRRATGPFLLR